MPYDENYESALIRGDEEPRAWDLIAEIARYAKPTDILLDVGCGTAFKTLRLADKVNRIAGLDPNPRMLAQARRNIRMANVSNMQLFEGTSERMPFPDSHFDLVTCIMAHQSLQEFHRVLKPGGRVISEQFGEQDKRGIANYFGSDEQGPRGIFARYGKGELIEEHRRTYESLFVDVSIRVGRWNSYLTYEGLVDLLEQVPLVRNFDSVRDELYLNRLKEELMTSRGIPVSHDRVLITARKAETNNGR